ncbi:hypothetical protein THUN1379_16680 [Paludibacterium sp. THUN1379]|nr:hypothetical protein THUN1379_16680 [Paludibacterium sp. THUN1379]
MLWLSLLALPVLAAPADIPGWQAYQHHDYLAARQAFAAGAAAGNRVAMFDLAMMNWRGEGGARRPEG